MVSSERHLDCGHVVIDVSMPPADSILGLWTILLCLAITAGIVSQPGGIELYTYAYDHWIPLTSAAMVNATFQAVFVYINSFYSGELLALGGNSGVMIYDVSHLLDHPHSTSSQID